MEIEKEDYRDRDRARDRDRDRDGGRDGKGAFVSAKRGTLFATLLCTVPFCGMLLGS